MGIPRDALFVMAIMVVYVVGLLTIIELVT